MIEPPNFSSESSFGEKDSVIAREERGGSVEGIQEVREFFIAGGKKSVEARLAEFSQERNTFIFQVPATTGTN
jgi:hypothetical protein